MLSCAPPPQVFVTSVLVAVFFEKPQAQWTMGATMIDFALRFWGGANISAAGSLAQVVVAGMELFGSKPK